MANNVPKIRFNGFDDEWEEKKLGDLTTEFQSGKSIKASDIHDNGSYPVYGGNGLRGYTETFNHNGDFTLIGRQGALSGNVNFSTGKAFFTEHAVVVKANDTNNTKFLYYLMDNLKLGRWVTQSAQPGLAVGTLVAIHSSVPHYNEQSKIGTLFQTLDNQITLQQSELDQQREFKKNMLQKMFPRKGVKEPEIRFNGFSGEWDEKKLGELGSIQTGNTPKSSEKNNYENDGQGMMWITPTDIDSLHVTKSEKTLSELGIKKARVVPAGSILVTCIASIGKNTIVTKSAAFNQQINALVPSQNTNSYFLLTLSLQWSKFMKNIASAGTMQIVNKSEFSNIVTLIPSLDEQTQIGNFFKSLDDHIESLEQQLEHTKQMKHALLQKMFV